MYRILTIVAVFLFETAALAEDPPKYVFQLKAVDVKNADTPLAKLLKERYNAAIDFAQEEMLRVESGRVTITALGEAMDMLVGAGLELFTEPKERLAVLEESVRYSQFAEKITAIRHEAGTVPRSDVNRAKYIHATAEIRLLREKEKAKR